MLITFLATSLLALVSWLFVPWKAIQSFSEQLGTTKAIREKLEASSISICYGLFEEEWTTFPLPQETQKIRILSHVDVKQSPQSVFSYPIRWRARNSSGDVLKEGTYHFLTRKIEYYDPTDKKMVDPSYYLQPGIRPTSASGLILNFEKDFPEDESVADIQLMQAPASDPFEQVVVRCYYEERPSVEVPVLFWKRLSYNVRKNLSSSNVYPQKFITDQEKLNLLNRKWIPFGPAGIDGEEYVIRKLYRLKDFEGLPFETYTNQSGFPLSPHLNMTINLAHIESQTVSFSFALPYDTTFQQRKTLKITHFPTGGEPLSEELRLRSAKDLSFTREYTQGMLLLESDSLLFTTIQSLNEQDTEESLLKSTQFSHALMLNGESPPLYDIHHTRGEPTPYRFDFRTILDYPLEEGASVKVTFKDKDSNTLRNWIFPAPRTPSVFDFMKKAGEDHRVSERESHYFLLPPQVAQIEFSSEFPVLISTHNRIYQSPHTRFVPEDYTMDMGLKGEPFWYACRPQDYEAFIERDEGCNVFTQKRPPLQEEEISWVSHQPLGDYRANQILYPVGEDKAVNDKSRAVYYYALPPNEKVEVKWERGEFAVLTNKPELLFEKIGQDRVNVEIKLDDVSVGMFDFIERSATFQLPFIQNETSKLEIVTDSSVKIYLNQQYSDEPRYLKRTGFLLTKDIPFEFHIRKENQEESHLFQFFRLISENKERSVIKISLQGKNETVGMPMIDYTLTNREFDINGDPLGTLSVFSQPSQKVGLPEPFFMKLYKDLSPGEYRIQVSLVSGESGYFSILQKSNSIASFHEYNY